MELGYWREEESSVLEIKEADGSSTQLQMEKMELWGHGWAFPGKQAQSDLVASWKPDNLEEDFWTQGTVVQPRGKHGPVNVLGSDQSDEWLLPWEELQEGDSSREKVGVLFPVLPSMRQGGRNLLFLSWDA